MMSLPSASPDPSIKIELENVELWRKFHQHNNEMILTKGGRRMFPCLRFKVSGLKPKANYSMILEFVPADDCRYKFQKGLWAVSGRAERTSDSNLRTILHPDSPSSGDRWSSQTVTFNRLKLTNHVTQMDNKDQVLLFSMHKYLPRLYVVELASENVQHIVAGQSFPETTFISVTAYQNDQIIKLKIDNNPFAKGFREVQKRSRSPPQNQSPTPKRERRGSTESTRSSPASSVSSSSAIISPVLCHSFKDPCTVSPNLMVPTPLMSNFPMHMSPFFMMPPSLSSLNSPFPTFPYGTANYGYPFSVPNFPMHMPNFSPFLPPNFNLPYASGLLKTEKNDV